MCVCVCKLRLRFLSWISSKDKLSLSTPVWRLTSFTGGDCYCCCCCLFNLFIPDGKDYQSCWCCLTEGKTLNVCGRHQVNSLVRFWFTTNVLSMSGFRFVFCFFYSEFCIILKFWYCCCCYCCFNWFPDML